MDNPAAILLEESGQFEDAVSLFTEASDWGGAVSLICNQASALLNQGRGQILSAWLDKLPQELIDNTAWLLYWKGVCKLLVNPEDGLPFFEKAFQIFSKEEAITGLSLSACGAIDSIFYSFRDYSRLDTWIDEMNKISDRCSSYPSPENPLLSSPNVSVGDIDGGSSDVTDEVKARITYTIFRSLLFRNTGHSEFHKWAEKALHLFQHSRDILFRMEFIFHIVFYCHLSGDFRRAFMLMQTIEEASLHLPETATPLAILGWQSARAFYFWLTGSIDKCLEAVSEGLKVSQKTGVHILDYVLLGQGIAAALSGGDMKTAGKLLKSMASSLDMMGHNNRAFYHFAASWEALLKKDRHLALQHAEASLGQAEELGGEWQKIPAQLMITQVSHEQGDLQKAEEHLTSVRRFAVQSKSIFFEYIYLLTDAWFALDRGDENACLNNLRKAMAIGREKGLINFWGWRPDVMARLCTKALDADIEVNYVQELIRRRGLLPDNHHIYSEKWPWPLKIYTLGEFRVVRDEETIGFKGKSQRKPLDLLKVLIALGGKGVKIEEISEEIWPDADGDRGYSSFTTTMNRLRSLIGSKAIQSRGKSVSLDPNHCYVDVWAFEHLLSDIGKSNPTAPDFWHHIEKILTLYQGHFIEGEDRLSGVTFYRDRLWSKFLSKIHKIGIRLEKAGEHEKAAALYQKGLEADPLSEELYRYLMVCYSLMGRPAEVQKVYVQCRKTLMTALKVEPSMETGNLLQKLLAK
ncbi:MAG: hypothetical protein HZA08_00190 [Nitrospirae bacterium]|nr:hypothetical protein [Nitrospirota bacterium]